MHMGDALISPAIGAGFWAGSLFLLVRSAGRVKERVKDDGRIVPLMGVLGAFIFAAQMINFTIPGTGSSGHIGGGMILSILLGPYEAFMVMASVLTIQALLFADGGILALGCNIWNLAFYPAFIAHPFLFRPMAGKKWSRRRVLLASMVSAIAALEMGAFSVVLQVLLSGRTEIPFKTFTFLMLSIHLAIAIGEGLVTGGFVNYLRDMRPEILEEGSKLYPAGRFVLEVLLIALFVGGFLSLYASTYPDGLEWTIQKIYGGPPPFTHPFTAFFEALQRSISPFPDYGLKDLQGWFGSSFAGMVGVISVFALITGLAFILRYIGGKDDR